MIPEHRHHINALRRTARRLAINVGDRAFLLEHLDKLEGWLDEMHGVERREADAINATGLRPCQHQGRAP